MILAHFWQLLKMKVVQQEQQHIGGASCHSCVVTATAAHGVFSLDLIQLTEIKRLRLRLTEIKIQRLSSCTTDMPPTMFKVELVQQQGLDSTFEF